MSKPISKFTPEQIDLAIRRTIEDLGFRPAHVDFHAIQAMGFSVETMGASTFNHCACTVSVFLEGDLECIIFVNNRRRGAVSDFF